MDQWSLGMDIVSDHIVWPVVLVVTGSLLAVLLIGAVVTQFRYGGVLKEVGRSPLFWSVVGCDVGPAMHHKSSLLYWRVGCWRVAGRPDLLIKHRLLPIIEIFEIKSRAKARPSPYEFLQVQIYLSAASQAFPGHIKRARVVYPGKTIFVKRSRTAKRFLRRVLSDVKAHLANGLSDREVRDLQQLVVESTH